MTININPLFFCLYFEHLKNISNFNIKNLDKLYLYAILNS